MKRKIILITISMLVFLNLGCVVQANENLLFGINMRGLYDDHSIAENQGAIDMCEQLGIKYVAQNSKLDPDLQLSQIDNFIQMGADALILTPQDCAAIIPGIKKLNKEGIVIVSIDGWSLGGKPDLFIAVDNTAAGKRAGEALVELLKEKYGKPQGVILEIQGDLRHTVTFQRHQGFKNVIDKYKDIKIIEKTAEWLPDKAGVIVENLFTAQRDTIDAIYVHSDGCYLPGVIPALKRAGYLYPVGHPKHIFVVGIDGQPLGIQYVRSKLVDRIVLQFPDIYGKMAVEWAAKILKGEKIPEQGAIIDKEALWGPVIVGTVETGPAFFLNPTIVPTEVSAYDLRLYGVRCLYEKENK